MWEWRIAQSLERQNGRLRFQEAHHDPPNVRIDRSRGVKLRKIRIYPKRSKLTQKTDSEIIRKRFGNHSEMFGNNPNDSERNPNDFRMKSELFPNRPLQINEHLMAIQPTNDDLSQFNAKFAIKGGRSGKVWRFVFNGVPYGSLLKFTVADPYGSPTPFWHLSDTFLTLYRHFFSL